MEKSARRREGYGEAVVESEKNDIQPSGHYDRAGNGAGVFFVCHILLAQQLYADHIRYPGAAQRSIADLCGEQGYGSGVQTDLGDSAVPVSPLRRSSVSVCGDEYHHHFHQKDDKPQNRGRKTLSGAG